MKRIKFLCFVLLIVFFGSIYQGALLPFYEGVKYGMAVARFQIESNSQTDDFVLMEVSPKMNNYLEKTEKNIKTGEPVYVRPNTVSIMTTKGQPESSYRVVSQVFAVVVGLIVIVLSVWIPFLVVKIVRSLQRSEVFDRNNLKRINRIGFILLSVGVLESVLQWLNVFTANSVVELEHYHLTYNKIVDFYPIIMGIVVLIMNEILRIGTDMKDEQDLTI